MIIEFNAKLVAAAAMSQSKGDGRYYLQGVYFTDKQVVGTNGHIMTVGYDSESVFTEVNSLDEDSDVILPISTKDITALKSKHSDTVIFNVKDETLKVLDSCKSVLHMAQCKRIDATYPDWERVIPQIKDEQARFTNIDGKYLKLISETAKVLGKRSVVIRATDSKSSSPCLITYDLTNVYSIVMPLKDEELLIETPSLKVPPQEKMAA